jgi:hypothetical protein
LLASRRAESTLGLRPVIFRGVDGIGELLDDIFAVGRVCYLVVGVGRIKHAEAIVVLRREDQISLVGDSCKIDKMIRIPFARIEALRQSAIICLGDSPIARCHDGP